MSKEVFAMIVPRFYEDLNVMHDKTMSARAYYIPASVRMNDLVEGCKITGELRLDGEDIYGDMDVNLLRKRVGMVFQKPNPFPMSHSRNQLLH